VQVVNDDDGKEPPMPRSPKRLATGLALTLALTGVAAACGDDDEAAADTPAPEAAAVSTEACDAFTALSGALAGDPSQLATVVAEFESTAPAPLADDARTYATAYESLEAEGPAAFGTPAFVEASSAIADAYFEGCEVSTELAVDGVDYAFEGIPERIDAGRVAVRFTNRTEHDEPHELVLFRKNPGTTETAEELLSLPEEESMAKVTMAGVVFADQPNQESVAMFDLEPGSYVAVCFIPVGGGEDGPPHFMSGMVSEFEAS
jgi:hypothetical protein